MVGSAATLATVALPLTAPLVAVTVPLAAVPDAVNSPLELIAPPVTVVVHVKVGGIAMALPN